MVENPMTQWFKKNKTEIIIVLAILLLAAFLRFYRLEDYMTFLGDEGRDAIIVKDILTNQNLPLLGPPTSVGNIYLGPLYYYMMAGAMGIFWLNPVAAAGMVALIGVATVFLVFYLSKVWFGLWPAVVSSVLYAVSPINVMYSRSSWNPNPAPFFTLLAMFGFYNAHKSKNYLWFIVSGASLAAALQMHYLAIILLPIFGVLWIRELINKDYKKHFILGSFGGILAFLFLMSPLVVFDLRYNFMNWRAISALFSGQGTAVSFSLQNTLSQSLLIFRYKLIERYIGADNTVVASITSLVVLLPLIISVIRKMKKQAVNWAYFPLGVWLVLGLIGLSFYKNSIYDHYLGFINPAPYLLLGGLIGYIKNRWQIGVVVVLLILLGTLNLQKSPLRQPPGNQLERTKQITKFVIEESSNKPFNFALIAQRNYDAAYQYYFDIFEHKPKVVPVEVTDQLYVVCEDETCMPVGHAKYEIAGFGLAKIEKMEKLLGVKIYKLVANPGGKPS